MICSRRLIQDIRHYFKHFVKTESELLQVKRPDRDKTCARHTQESADQQAQTLAVASKKKYNFKKNWQNYIFLKIEIHPELVWDSNQNLRSNPTIV